ncbi:mycofactocin precursor MftA [Actinospica sp. MGRD01-02]|uniref:Mycofactocin MftA n=2 Tax=Actinospica acidithermotolerans TaxID=2828514 RepID=A0A941IG33_9ACTN|nr:mycofactocin precursor MftA [Actinospica acidithermotolerans]
MSPPANPQQPLSVRTPAGRESAAESATENSRIRTADVIEADELVEEVSIDGMCGVY